VWGQSMEYQVRGTGFKYGVSDVGCRVYGTGCRLGSMRCGFYSYGLRATGEMHRV
jgi:hypothetical protein